MIKRTILEGSGKFSAAAKRFINPESKLVIFLKQRSYIPILDDKEKADPQVARAQEVVVTGFFLSGGMLCINNKVKAVMASVWLKLNPGIYLKILIASF